MLTAIKGYYDHGQIVLQEEAPVQSKAEGIITFLTESPVDATRPATRVPGGLKGQVTIPDDFNAPLDDLHDYM